MFVVEVCSKNAFYNTLVVVKVFEVARTYIYKAKTFFNIPIICATLIKFEIKEIKIDH